MVCSSPDDPKVELTRWADFPLHPNSADLAAYYQSYAKHFELLNRIVFNASVGSLTRTEDGTKWALLVEGEASPRVFDKVVVATGTEVTASVPEIEGLDRFEGRFLHSQEYKRYDFYGWLCSSVLLNSNPDRKPLQGKMSSSSAKETQRGTAQW